MGRLRRRVERHLLPAAPGRRPGVRAVEPVAPRRAEAGTVRRGDARVAGWAGGRGERLDEGRPRPDRAMGAAAVRHPGDGRVRAVGHPGGAAAAVRDRCRTHRGGHAVRAGRHGRGQARDRCRGDQAIRDRPRRPASPSRLTVPAPNPPRPFPPYSSSGMKRALPLIAVVVLAAPCGHASSRQASPPTHGPSPSPVDPPPLPEAATRCGDPGPFAEAFWFRAADGALLDGIVLGGGPAGVVLAHQYPADLCGWWPYALVLARDGFRVLLFDFRCFGLSPCPTEGGGDLSADGAGAAAELRRRGATTVALVGASLGGTTSLMAATKMTPQPDAVVSLSGEPD